MKLTEEQSEIVSENHNLIYWYARHAKLNLQDWYDLLAIELCYAVMKHDPTKSSLATYYKLRCDGMVLKEFRKSKSQKRDAEVIHYSENYHNEEDPNDLQEWVELQEFLGIEHGRILQMKYEGYTQAEMAKAFGVSQSYISKILKKIKEDYGEYDR